MRGRTPLAAALLAAALAAGCASIGAPQSRALLAAGTGRAPVELTQVPYFAQQRFHCGPASLAMAAGAAGVAVTPEAIADQVFVPAREGALQVEMLAAARRQGLVAVRLPGTLAALLAEVDAGHPVVVLLNLGLAAAPRWHYAVVIGHDLGAGELLLRSGDEPRQRLRLATFEHTWARGGHWAFVALPPGRLPASADEHEAVQAALGFERVAPPQAVRATWAAVHARWPGSLVAAVGHGNALFAAGDARAAAAVFADAARRHDSAAAWHNLAHARLALGERDAAREAAQRAVAAAVRREGDSVWHDAALRTLGEIDRR